MGQRTHTVAVGYIARFHGHQGSSNDTAKIRSAVFARTAVLDCDAADSGRPTLHRCRIGAAGDAGIVAVAYDAAHGSRSSHIAGDGDVFHGALIDVAEEAGVPVVLDIQTPDGT